MDLHKVEHHLGSLIKGTIHSGEPMKSHTSWRIGGPADIMVFPSVVDDIRLCKQFAQKHHIPITVMGNGSNLLVRDNGVRGIVLKLSRGFNQIQITNNVIYAQAGAMIPLVARRSAAAGLSGLEFAAGIPASVGGAIAMNAGAHGKSMDKVVKEVTVLNPEGETAILTSSEIGFQYRKTGIQNQDLIVLDATFFLEPGNVEEIKGKIELNLAKRRHSQPLEFPNAGSVFANPPGQWAGWLIEQVGGKGLRIGDAMVSEKHANFIVNVGEASAHDVLSLVGEIRRLVMEQFNIELKLEVRVIGE